MPDSVRPSIRQQSALLMALRGGMPDGEDDPATIEALLRRYECGGWLHQQRAAAGATPLPEPWCAAAARAHRKTLVDSLAALGVLGEVLTRFNALDIPVVVLKGGAYLGDLYQDPGERMLTDIDLLVTPHDVARAAESLVAAGFILQETHDSPHVREYRRFEMARPGPAPCRVEIHWQLGTGGRMRFDQEGIWARSRPGAIQGAACRRLDPHDGLLYHVGHAAEHYFGPGLKWALDLRAMLERFRPDPRRLRAGARDARVRVALQLALCQIEALFPGSAPPALLEGRAPGGARGLALARIRLDEPLEFLPGAPGGRGRALLRLMMYDSTGDVLAVALTVLLRPWRRRHGPPAARPWEAALGGD